MIGQTILHYQITAKIGAGGMGEVYLATDTKLKRKVALKFLPESLARNSEARERLLREAQAASVLSHPNIVTVHSIEEADDRDFIVMEFVDGATLDDYCDEKLPAQDALLGLAIGMASGLVKAHEAGVVHRDLKPSNVLVDADGRARILDFGLAKIAGAAKLTKTGSTVGTVAYMSPEQGRGDEADYRSDIFSFGVILYQMIARQAPFGGDHDAAILYAIANEEPEPLARYKSDVPEALQRIVTKCLAKSPADRYQSAADLVTDLNLVKRASAIGAETSSGAEQARPKSRTGLFVSSTALIVIVLALLFFRPWQITVQPTQEAVAGRTMIAVLPFENLGAADDEYFADGITDEIIGKLVAIQGLGVISRTSSMKYKDTEKSLREIGDELGVDFLLEGTIRWDNSGDVQQVRILPQLIRVSDDTHLWAETYQRELTEIFAVQAEIATSVAGALGIALLEPDRRSVEARPTENMEAYQAYLRGIEIAQRFGRNITKRIQMFARAIKFDSMFAAAHAELSMAYSAKYHFGYDRTEADQVSARQHADKALALDPQLADAHRSLGYYHYWGFRDYENALQAFKTADRLLPNDDRNLYALATIKKRTGDFTGAVAGYRSAFRLNPQSYELLNEIALCSQYRRRFQDTEDACNKMIALAPDLPWGYFLKAHNYILWTGDIKKVNSVLADIPMTGAPQDSIGFLIFDFMNRDYQTALHRMDFLPGDFHIDQDTYFPNVGYKGFAYSLMGKDELAYATHDSARVLLEGVLRERPDDFRVHLGLGKIYIELRQKDKAITYGMRAAELWPPSKDAQGGTNVLEELSGIYAWVGEHEKALDLIEQLLNMPSMLSIGKLRLHPKFDPLRDNPRFQALLGQEDVVF